MIYEVKHDLLVGEYEISKRLLGPYFSGKKRRLRAFKLGNLAVAFGHKKQVQLKVLFIFIKMKKNRDKFVLKVFTGHVCLQLYM